MLAYMVLCIIYIYSSDLFQRINAVNIIIILYVFKSIQQYIIQRYGWCFILQLIYLPQDKWSQYSNIYILYSNMKVLEYIIYLYRQHCIQIALYIDNLCKNRQNMFYRKIQIIRRDKQSVEQVKESFPYFSLR